MTHEFANLGIYTCQNTNSQIETPTSFLRQAYTVTVHVLSMCRVTGDTGQNDVTRVISDVRL